MKEGHCKMRCPRKKREKTEMSTTERQIALGGVFKSKFLAVLAEAMKADRAYFVYDKPPVSDSYYEPNDDFRKRLEENIQENSWEFPYHLWGREPKRKEKGQKGKWLVLYTVSTQDAEFDHIRHAIWEISNEQFQQDNNEPSGLYYRTSALHNKSYRYVLDSFSFVKEKKSQPSVDQHEPATVLPPATDTGKAHYLQQPEFWQNTRFGKEEMEEIKKAMVKGFQLRKQFAIAELKSRMAALGLTTKDLR